MPSNDRIYTTLERLDFVRRTIAERRRLAVQMRQSAEAATSQEEEDYCLEEAERAEVMANAKETLLAVLFPGLI